MRYLLALMFIACGSAPRSFQEIRTAAASPSGTVDSKTAQQIVLYNQTRNALLSAIGVLQTRVPVNYGIARDTIYGNTCANQATDGSQQTSAIDLSNATDAGTTGMVTVSFSCSAETYNMSLIFNGACTKALCFTGTLRIESTATQFTWALKADTKPPSGSTTTPIDIGGVAEVTANGFTNDRVVGYFGTPKPTPILLTWSTPGTNKYSEFFLTGKTRYICHVAASHTCDPVDASDNATGGVQLSW